MLDIKWINLNQYEAKINLKKRGLYNEENFNKIITTYERQKILTRAIQALQGQRNQKSELVRCEKDLNIKNTIISEVKQINLDIDKINIELSEIDINLEKLLSVLPNILQLSVPEGESEKDNIVMHYFHLDNKNNIEKICDNNQELIYDSNELKHNNKTEELHAEDQNINSNFIKTHIVNTKNQPIFEHIDILEKLNCVEVEKTVAMSGPRFISMKNQGAKLERALKNFLLDYNAKNGFIEMSPPYLVQNHAAYNAGQLPKFEEDLFSVDKNYKLIPTAEVPLVNLYANTILDKLENPIRITAHTPCFRSEAGSAGRDTKGLIRLHQFHKVELVSICKPEQSNSEHEFMLKLVEGVLQKLELPYRVLLLCTKDTSHHSSKTYDIEVWFPAQQKYREISSISNCLDYQARRLKTKYKDQNFENHFVHMLNGSCLPLGRLLACIVENYINYDEDFIKIPTALVPYFGSELIK